MAKTLQEYADWLEGRDLIWPKPPKLEPAKATAYLKPLDGIHAVTWSLYGTLLHVPDGKLIFLADQKIRMQVALEKTIHEFNMWQSMSRKPGAPWEYMFQQYQDVLEENQMVGVKKRGDFPEVSSTAIWRKLVGRLEQKEYDYDESFFGDFDEFCEKVAYFFHANLQGVEATPQALNTLSTVSKLGLKQGLLADAQSFSLVQLLRSLKGQGTLPPLGQLFDPNCFTLSYQEGLRKPSRSLYLKCLQQFAELGLKPGEILHVGSRIADDLAIARQVGMKTVLYAGDKLSLAATSTEVKDPKTKPDRLITELNQICDILQPG